MRITPLLSKHWKDCGGLISGFSFSKCHGNPTFNFDFWRRFGFSKTDSELTKVFPHIPTNHHEWSCRFDERPAVLTTQNEDDFDFSLLTNDKAHRRGKMAQSRDDICRRKQQPWSQSTSLLSISEVDGGVEWCGWTLMMVRWVKRWLPISNGCCQHSIPLRNYSSVPSTTSGDAECLGY